MAQSEDEYESDWAFLLCGIDDERLVEVIQCRDTGAWIFVGLLHIELIFFFFFLRCETFSG